MLLRAARAPRAGLHAALLAMALHAAADTDSERRVGDVLSLALPAGVAAVELWRGDHEGAWQLAQVFALTTGVAEILKNTTGVTRPDGSDDKSFPSGHAARAFSAAAYVQQRHGWAKAWPLWLAGTYVGHTRVQADRHRWREVAVSGALAYGFALWRVEPAAGRQTRAWVGPDGRGGWQAGLAIGL